MLSNAEILMNVVHEARVRQATAHCEHRFEARLAARARAEERSRFAGASGWKIWRRLGTSRGERKAV
jgi:hypothetical protein